VQRAGGRLGWSGARPRRDSCGRHGSARNESGFLQTVRSASNFKLGLARNLDEQHSPAPAVLLQPAVDAADQNCSGRVAILQLED
jgi:hypothetical protein